MFQLFLMNTQTSCKLAQTNNDEFEAMISLALSRFLLEIQRTAMFAFVVQVAAAVGGNITVTVLLQYIQYIVQYKYYR